MSNNKVDNNSSPFHGQKLCLGVRILIIYMIMMSNNKVDNDSSPFHGQQVGGLCLGVRILIIYMIMMSNNKVDMLLSIYIQ